MKKGIVSVGLAAAMAVVCGCSSVNLATQLHGQKLTASDEPIAHINGSCSGLYFLPIVPLFTGSTGHPGLPAFFSDDVTPKSVVDMVTAESKKQGATKTMDLESRTSSVWLFPTVFFWYKSVEVSGNAVK